jgi:hypothetical protein
MLMVSADAAGAVFSNTCHAHAVGLLLMPRSLFALTRVTDSAVMQNQNRSFSPWYS